MLDARELKVELFKLNAERFKANTHQLGAQHRSGVLLEEVRIDKLIEVVEVIFVFHAL